MEGSSSSVESRVATEGSSIADSEAAVMPGSRFFAMAMGFVNERGSETLVEAES